MCGKKIAPGTDTLLTETKNAHRSQDADLLECIDIIGGDKIRNQQQLHSTSSQHVTIRGSDYNESLRSLEEQ